jgi:single-strand DNA-binding protein
MSKDLNLCQFIGRLGNDPDIRMTQSGTTTASFNLACGDDYKDKQTGQKVEQTNWIRCVAFGRLAEILKDYTRKGSKVYVSGKQSTRKWQNQAGVDQYTTEITINEMQMLDGKQEGQPQQQRQQQQPRQAQPRQQAPMPQDNFDTDDIPF